MREAKCMREVHKQHYACAFKIASEQRATDFKPGISWFVAQVVSGTSKLAPANVCARTRLLSPNRPFPNLPTRGAGGKRTLCASCKLATTHAPVIKSISQ